MNAPASQIRRGGWALLAAPTLAALGLAIHLPPLALVNVSPSIPRGLYVRALDQRPRPGTVVAVKPPPVARRYLDALGMPATAPLLKRVAAVGGDAVCRRGAALHWSNRAAWAMARDLRGVVLPAWSGCRRLAPDEVLVMGDTATSFDSRYFGPIRRSGLEGVYLEALSW